MKLKSSKPRYRLFVAVAFTLSLVAFDSARESLAGGFNGRGGGGGGRAGGMSRPSMGGGGGMQRPSMGGGGGGMQRPNVSRPASMPSMGNMSRPSPRPNIGSMPGMGSSGNMSRPSTGLSNLNRPAPSLPTTRPSTGMKPTTRPATRPSLENRPGSGNQIAGGGGSLRPGNLPGSLPEKLPGSLPSNRPTTLPGTLPAGRPNIASRPGDLTRPGNKLPNDRPGFTKPTTRPAPGDLGDFLGMGKPLRPTTLPGDLGTVGTRPNLPGGIADGGLGTRPLNPNNKLPPGFSPENRPGGNLSGNNRPINNKPIDWGNVNIGNTVINQRPSWVSIDRNQYVNVSNRWQSQLGGMHNWPTTQPGRIDYWNRWGDDVRHHWHHHYYDCQGWFRPSWWNDHPHGWGAWHYGYWYHNRPWNYWWTVPAFSAFNSWFTWSAPQTVWAQPVYYDYGQGGNVVYNNEVVYMNEQPTATADEFAQTAAVLASVPPPKDEAVLKEMEWMALGTFAITADEKDVDPSRVIQLAVNKQGIISGTMYNSTTDKAHAVQGRVDKETQRVAFRIGDSEDVICETGLYNLTQAQAPMLVHFGTEKDENYLLVRIEQPEDETAKEPSLP